MRVVNFLGGLGNQMFIYMLYRHLRDTYPDERIWGCYTSGSLNVHVGLEIEKVFDVRLPGSSVFSDVLSILYRMCKRMGWTRWENSRDFTRYDVVFDGYWLDGFFYRDKNVRDIFRFRNTSFSGACREYIDIMSSVQSVAVHVRRGDYLSKENMELFGKFCDIDYYKKALEVIRNKVADPVFFIFSDDMEWVKANMSVENAFYVDENKGVDSWKDMYLMSRCRHAVIANSTFSYWAAMLRESEGLVLYPRKWYYWNNPDIFPEEWMAV